MATVGYIRVTGQHHALHDQGAVLAVTDNRQANNPELIFRDDAHQLVDRGDAEWIRGSELPAETAEERADRHEDERAALAAQQAAEHGAVVTGLVRGRETADARAIRHLGERSGMLTRQAYQHRVLMARNAPQAEHTDLMHRQSAEYRGLIDRQLREPETQAMEQFSAHADAITRHVAEHAVMLARHGAEQQAAVERESVQ
jgi:hypothetical protein